MALVKPLVLGIDGLITQIQSGDAIPVYVTATKSLSYTETATSGDVVNFLTGPITVTLPTAVGNVASLYYKVTGGGVVTVAAAGVQTIDGSASVALPINSSLTLRSDNANWWVM